MLRGDPKLERRTVAGGKSGRESGAAGRLAGLEGKDRCPPCPRSIQAPNQTRLLHVVSRQICSVALTRLIDASFLKRSEQPE